MATEQKKLAIYVPRDEAERFEALVKAEGKTVTGAFRVMLREYLEAAEKPSGHMMGTEAPA